MSFTDKAIEAVMGNDKFQTYVRDFIASAEGGLDRDSCANNIAMEIGAFRVAIEPWVHEPVSKSEVADRRKKVNNIVNDTSRICRELLGYTIKCTSRKNHHYGATEYLPPVKSERTELPPIPFKIITKADVPEALQLDIILESIDTHPIWTLEKLIEIHGAVDIGGRVAQLLRERS